MLLILSLLIGLGVVLSLTAVIFPVSGDKDSSRKRSFEQAATDVVFVQLKEQISSLENEVRLMAADCSAMSREFSRLRSKESRLIEHLLNQKNLGDAQNEIYQLTSDNLILQNKVNRLLVFEEENKELSSRVRELTSDVERFQNERQSKDNQILQLRQKCEYAQAQLDDLNTRLNEASSGYDQEKKRSTELRENLFKQKVIYSDTEKELQQLREENEELKDGLAYERTN